MAKVVMAQGVMAQVVVVQVVAAQIVTVQVVAAQVVMAVCSEGSIWPSCPQIAVPERASERVWALCYVALCCVACARMCVHVCKHATFNSHMCTRRHASRVLVRSRSARP